MGPFIPSLSSLTAPLRELVKKGNTFKWTPSHQAAFETIKSKISEKTTLAYYDPAKKIVLQVDVSMKDQGRQSYCFYQQSADRQLVCYANIERELLAVVYGCERFHTYLYGQNFVAETDRKPLESIQLKHLTSVPPRLQRMLLRLQLYDVTIKYLPGSAPIPGLNVQIHEFCLQVSNEYL